jgi:hypothetical protein
MDDASGERGGPCLAGLAECLLSTRRCPCTIARRHLEYWPSMIISVQRVLATFGLTGALLLSSTPAPADAVADAFRLCAIMNHTKLLSEPCKVSGWNSSVDVSIDTTAAEARKICAGLHRFYEGKLRFDGKWTLRIFSPYSGDRTIATCALR